MRMRMSDWYPGLIVTLGFSSLLLLTTASRANARPWNIVLLLVDDMGWTGPGCYGSDLHETPAIDRFAASGMKFTSAYAAAPVCTPTRASIMTGKSPARLHMTIWRESARNRVFDRRLLPPDTRADLPKAEVTIAEVLREAGYVTAHLGKWHLGGAADYPLNHGFDLNIGGTLWGCPATFFYPYAGPFGRQREMRFVPDLPWGSEGEYLTDRLTDEALRVIDQAGDRPFFLNMCYYTVHTPIEGKPRLVAYYEKKVKEGMDHTNARYAAMHQSLDESVGRILTRLDARGIADRTLVLLGSDNGGYVNKYRGERVTGNHPLRSGKGSLYEGGIRVPLIIRWPGITSPGSVCDQPVSTIDFYPTLLEVTGLAGDSKYNAGVEGMSLVPLLQDAAAMLGRDALYFHYPHYYQTTSPVSAVRAGRWKLLEYYEDQHVELYDLVEDIGETRNLAAKMPAKGAELGEMLHVWLKSVEAQMATTNPDYKP